MAALTCIEGNDLFSVINDDMQTLAVADALFNQAVAGGNVVAAELLRKRFNITRYTERGVVYTRRKVERLYVIYTRCTNDSMFTRPEVGFCDNNIHFSIPFSVTLQCKAWIKQFERRCYRALQSADMCVYTVPLRTYPVENFHREPHQLYEYCQSCMYEEGEEDLEAKATRMMGGQAVPTLRRVMACSALRRHALVKTSYVCCPNGPFDGNWDLIRHEGQWLPSYKPFRVDYVAQMYPFKRHLRSQAHHMA